jgi:hypothetical protein
LLQIYKSAEAVEAPALSHPRERIVCREDQFFDGAAVPPEAPLHDVFEPPAAPLHELFAEPSGAADEPAPVGVVVPPDDVLSPPHPASRPTRMPEAAVTARVLPIFMSFSSCVSLGDSKDF